MYIKYKYIVQNLLTAKLNLIQKHLVLKKVAAKNLNKARMKKN